MTDDLTTTRAESITCSRPDGCITPVSCKGLPVCPDAALFSKAACHKCVRLTALVSQQAQQIATLESKLVDASIGTDTTGHDPRLLTGCRAALAKLEAQVATLTQEALELKVRGDLFKEQAESARERAAAAEQKNAEWAEKFALRSKLEKDNLERAEAAEGREKALTQQHGILEHVVAAIGRVLCDEPISDESYAEVRGVVDLKRGKADAEAQRDDARAALSRAETTGIDRAAFDAVCQERDQLEAALTDTRAETTRLVDEERRRWYRALEQVGLPNLEGLAPEVVAQRVQRLSAALQTYGRHKQSCRLSACIAENCLTCGPCTCGLAEAILALGTKTP